jgi:hypothetical protein|tara:strand:- start:2804 stop:2971 length:168 start_codon:yes stop_codon:yes gene_type:complete
VPLIVILFILFVTKIFDFPDPFAGFLGGSGDVGLLGREATGIVIILLSLVYTYIL